MDTYNLMVCTGFMDETRFFFFFINKSGDAVNENENQTNNGLNTEYCHALRYTVYLYMYIYIQPCDHSLSVEIRVAIVRRVIMKQTCKKTI